ncbi:MAG: ATP-binding protein [Bacteroidetes bacterium]|nr:ATP-binding protein [Bacteroidota bacterium]
MKKGSSLSQNIDALCFAQNGTLKDEFSILFSSLFKQSENHVKVVELLGRKAKGMTREEIIKTSRLPDGGGLSKTLEELEQCGFIRRYRSYGKKSKLQIYQLIDFYTLFYLNFIKDNNFDDENFWTNFIDNARHRAWSGYAFEQVCMAHIRQIKNKLGIAGVLTYTASWRSQKSEPGAQIDLLIDRNDQVINLCEIKYANAEFAIDKRYDEVLRNKKNAFEQESNTKKAVHLTMITTYGVRRNEFSGSIQSEIKMAIYLINLLQHYFCNTTLTIWKR